MVLWSFAKMRQPCPNLLEAASKPLAATWRLARVPPSLLPTLLWSLASLIEICGGRAGTSSGRAGSGGISREADSFIPTPASWSEGVSSEVSFSVGRRGTRGGGRGLVLAGMMPLEVLRMTAEGPLLTAPGFLSRMTAQGKSVYQVGFLFIHASTPYFWVAC